jgi:hypothetical protein
LHAFVVNEDASSVNAVQTTDAFWSGGTWANTLDNKVSVPTVSKVIQTKVVATSSTTAALLASAYDAAGSTTTNLGTVIDVGSSIGPYRNVWAFGDGSVSFLRSAASDVVDNFFGDALTPGSMVRLSNNIH